MRTLYWLRRDLRLNHNHALLASESTEIYPVFILSDAFLATLGRASRWWLHQSLNALIKAYQDKGVEVAMYRGEPEVILPELALKLGADRVVWNRLYTPQGVVEGSKVLAACASHQLEARSFNSQLLIEPPKVFNKQGTPFKVFTPFWRACRAFLEPIDEARLPDLLPTTDCYPECVSAARLSLDALALTPTKPDWASRFLAYWTPGEASAQKSWAFFLDGSINHYGVGRDFPAKLHTSRLSPHLAWGEISAQQLFSETVRAIEIGHVDRENADKFLSEIGWREFCSYLLHHYPHLPERAFNPQFDAFEWREDEALLAAWQRGQTGYPMVDAGMRELWQTGFMHNRVRMVVASFLTKHLLLDWRQGAAWFDDTLLDADLGSNTAGWQWAAGSGADAAPYFRIFNPILQGEKFDREGDYVRRWVPELAQLPKKWLFKPWEAPEPVLQSAGVILGSHYPKPMVDHKEARELALSTYQLMRESVK